MTAPPTDGTPQEAGFDRPTARARRVRVEHLMGTAFSVDVRDPIDPARVDRLLDAFFAELRDVDDRFSPYRPESEVSRIADGSLAEDDASADLRWILGACEDLRRLSGGTFDARRHRPDERLDPSGIVKGWAVDEAVERHLVGGGLAAFQVNAGGDVVTSGEPEPGRAWRIGIRHPDHVDRVATALAVRDAAIATSGLYERGDHIRDPRGAGGDRGWELRSLTVVGPSLTWADAYATAAFPMGMAGLDWVHDRIGYGALAITADDRLVWTPSIDALRVED